MLDVGVSPWDAVARLVLCGAVACPCIPAPGPQAWLCPMSSLDWSLAVFRSSAARDASAICSALVTGQGNVETVAAVLSGFILWAVSSSIL